MTELATSVRKEITVGVPQERAFEVFAKQMGSWWNPDHHIGRSALADIILEPRGGGRWVEVGTDGEEYQWGRVLAWEPPARLLMAWQLNSDFEFDPELVTELEVRFIAVDAGTTRVVLEHRNLERYGDEADEMHATFDDAGGWAGLLTRFADCVQG